MLRYSLAIFILLAVLLPDVTCTLPSSSVKEILDTYKRSLNWSIVLDKSDKELLNSWSEDFQLWQINVTTKYRMQMLRHKQHSFKRIPSNLKWIQCLDLHTKSIRKAEQNYYENENECLKTANLIVIEKNRAVNQVEKEIKKWRRGYKYLKHLCDSENPKDEEASGICLIDYMQRDNYNAVLHRLMALKIRTVGELFLQMSTSINNLEVCLMDQLTAYLKDVRSIMEVLNECYETV